METGHGPRLTWRRRRGWLALLLGRRELARRFGAAFRLDEMVAELPGLAYAAAPI